MLSVCLCGTPDARQVRTEMQDLAGVPPSSDAACEPCDCAQACASCCRLALGLGLAVVRLVEAKKVMPFESPLPMRLHWKSSERRDTMFSDSRAFGA